MAFRLETPQEAASFRMREIGGVWEKTILPCPACGTAIVDCKKCRAKMRSPCRKLPGYHTHFVCFECGNVWMVTGWRF
jgi:predicted RNA-binding Zn-ribbon protein involved in translation (DUF1610 family)